MKIKICGLSRPEDIIAVNEALPDYIGFVFAPSKRQVTKEKARSLKEMLDSRIQAVGVFVDAPLEYILGLEKEKIIDIIQLHGQEDQRYIRELTSKTNCKIIKAISVETIENIRRAQNMGVDFLLLDNEQGGTGNCFAWSLVKKWEQLKLEDGRDGASLKLESHRDETSKTPYFLAGGIDLNNIREAMLAGSPFGIDISSGVETDGVKDSHKILEIVRRVRNG